VGITASRRNALRQHGLASAWLRRGITRRRKDLGELPRTVETNNIYSALIWANLRQEGPISYLCYGNRFADFIIEALAEYLTDLIRNAGRGRTDGHGDMDGHKGADHMNLEGARSETIAYWKDRSNA
jgi:hypothetical protein